MHHTIENSNEANKKEEKEVNIKENIKEKSGKAHKFVMALLAVTIIISGLNIINLSQANAQMNSMSQLLLAGGITGGAIAAQRSASPAALSDGAEVIPAGVPEIYGAELGVSFNDVSPDDQQSADAAIRKLGNLDRSITLSAADNERYVNILYRLHDGISCEYCCGARSIIFENGQPACGCAHSYAMRGLAKYLITEHGEEYADAEILEELGKWKTLFFPGQMGAKAAVLAQQGVEFNYINLASNKYRGAEKGLSSSGGMVGGC